jgi:hypothetical protein
VTTATKAKAPKAPDLLAEVDRLERAWREAEAKAKDAGTKHAQAFNRHTELADQRRRLAHREPHLVDHLGQPNPDITDNPVKAIDAEIAKLGDVNDLLARRDHARRLTEAAKQDWAGLVAEHFTEIVSALEPEAEAKVAAVQAAGEQLAAAVNDWLLMHARAVELTTAVAHVDGRSVPDNGGPTKLKQDAEALTLPLPLPRLP